MKLAGFLSILALELYPCLGQSSTDTIDVDVAIVGGGAAGSYAAVRLREDFNKTVVVIEKAARLVRISNRSPFHCLGGLGAYN